MIQITEVSIQHPVHIGNENYVLEYKCSECGKIFKEFYAAPSDDYHKMADLYINDHHKLHAESDLGRKFYDVISNIKGIK